MNKALQALIAVACIVIIVVGGLWLRDRNQKKEAAKAVASAVAEADKMQRIQGCRSVMLHELLPSGQITPRGEQAAQFCKVILEGTTEEAEDCKELIRAWDKSRVPPLNPAKIERIEYCRVLIAPTSSE